MCEVYFGSVQLCVSVGLFIENSSSLIPGQWMDGPLPGPIEVTILIMYELRSIFMIRGACSVIDHCIGVGTFPDSFSPHHANNNPNIGDPLYPAETPREGLIKSSSPTAIAAVAVIPIVLVLGVLLLLRLLSHRRRKPARYGIMKDFDDFKRDQIEIVSSLIYVGLQRTANHSYR